MRITVQKLLLLILFSIISVAAQDRHVHQNGQFRMIEKDFSQGKISYEQALLEKFYLVFDNKKSSYISSSPALVTYNKCATGLMMEYHNAKKKISESTRQNIDEYLQRPFKKTSVTSTYISSSGRFELTYSLSGTDAVPSADADGSGIPDYVEWVAQYFDYSWEFTIDSLGYLPPPIQSKRYQIGFEKMNGFYGTTYPEDNIATYIIMHNNFSGFPPNDDPEGDQKGAAKVTAMHEFKHAVQYVYNEWNEPEWFIEMDATWMEDIGYDYVNDYYNYLSGSQLLSPGRSFTTGEGYEDCLWLHYISQKHGVSTNRFLWERRLQKGTEEIFPTFQSILSEYSSSYTQALTEFFEWNYFTGSRANQIFPSYKEAARYPTSYVCFSRSVLPDSSSGCNIEPGGANYLVYKNININKPVRFSINDTSGMSFNVALLVLYKNGTSAANVFTAVEGSFSYTFSEALSSIEYFVFIPVVTSMSGVNLDYYCTVKPQIVAEFSMEPVADTEASALRIITAKVNNPDSLAVMNSLNINYSVNGSAYAQVSMASTGNPSEYQGIIPAAAHGSTVEYFLSVEDIYGDHLYYPERGAEDPFSYYVGSDIVSPSLVVSERNVLNKYNFPVTLYAEATDNIGIDSVYAEYSFNDGEIQAIKFDSKQGSLYSGKITLGSVSLETVTNFKYKIIATDSSSNHNTAYYPQSGYLSIDMDDGYEFISMPSKQITDYDDTGINDTITIPVDLLINDLNIAMNITHSRVSDLVVRITPPWGNPAILFSRLGSEAGGDSLKNPDIIFDQDAYYNIKAFSPDIDSTLSGEYKADTLNLDNYNGRNAKGIWILTVSDLASEETGIFNEWKLIIGADRAVSVSSENDREVMEYSLMQNYPNPFNPISNFRFRIADLGHVSIKIYDVLGKEVATVVDEEKSAGEYSVRFDAGGLASGVYYYQLKVNNFAAVKKFVLLK